MAALYEGVSIALYGAETLSMAKVEKIMYVME